MIRNLVGTSLANLVQVPKHFDTTLHKWLRTEGIVVNILRYHGFLTPQAKLTIIREAQRTCGNKLSGKREP
jgi:hypothetical protein